MIDQADFDWMEAVTILGLRVTKHCTYELAERCIEEQIPGDFAEAGCLSGGNCAIMARILAKHGVKDRRVHLYDSFEGHPQAGPGDGPVEQKQLGMNPDIKRAIPTGVCKGTIEQCELNMNNWVTNREVLTYHKGFLQELLPAEAEWGRLPKLALLRVDVDLHVSSLPVYKYLYPQVVDGGFIIVDDWGSLFCRNAFEEMVGALPKNVTPLEGQPTTVWWRKT